MWFVFDFFGGRKWKTINTSTQFSYEMEQQFCNFNNESLMSNLFNHTMALSSENIDYPDGITFVECFYKYGIWYLFFVLTGIYVTVGGCTNIQQQLKSPWKLNIEENSVVGKWQKFSIHCLIFYDILNISLVFYIAYAVMWWSPSKVLSISLTVLLVNMVVIEFLQFVFSPGYYLRKLDNYVDLTLFSVVYAILYEPNYWLENTSKYAMDIYNCGDCEPLEPSDCSVERSLAAIAIVLAVFRYVSLRNHFGHSPMNFNKKPKLYRIMFNKVLGSFYEVLKSYSFQIMSFGLGFYILLHKDTKSHNNTQTSSPMEIINEVRKCKEKDFCGNDAPYQFFDNPWLALLKTSTMFVGEIEFSDIPMEGGNVNAVLGYLYYLIFLFVVVLVLMNLLNAMAVSDISKIREESELECMLSNIEENNDVMDKLENSPLNIIIIIILLGIECILIIIIIIICVFLCFCCFPCILYWVCLNYKDNEKWCHKKEQKELLAKIIHFRKFNITHVRNRRVINSIDPRTGMLTLPRNSSNRY